MRRFRDIIEDIKAPSIQNLWLNGGKLKYYGENGWQDIKGQDAPTPSAYTLPIASASALGGVKSATTGTTSGRDYNVQVNSDGTMKVNVPWTDTNTTYNVATSSDNGLMSAADKSKLDNIASNANNYTLPNASTSVRGGVLMAAAVADLTGTEDAAAICTKVNALLSALRTAGILTS